jgi:phenylalanyl-tRNA synthetase beta chain
MKFSLSWLKEHLDTNADAQGVADMLNRIGHEVESIDNPAEKLSAFRIARVLTAAPHPQADKLQVLSVDAGGFWPRRCRRACQWHGLESRGHTRC